MKKFYNFLNLLFGLPKSLFVSMRYFGIRGLKLPILISSKVRIYELKGKIICSKIKFGIIRIGFSNKGIFDLKKDTSTIEFGHGMRFFVKSKCYIGPGARLSISGEIIFGDNFVLSGKNIIVCHKHISFGDDVLVSWGCDFLDTDFHYVETNKEHDIIGSINVGDHTWICSNVTILKNVSIGSNSVISSNEKLSNTVVDNNSLIKNGKIKEIIGWRR